MIAYEDLVAALKSWRARNGLPNTPPDYGDDAPASYADAPAPSGAVGDEIYDLSDDSGLIVAEDVQSSEAEYAEPYAGDAYGGDAYGEQYGDEQGAIQTGVEISTEAEAPEYSDYDNPPGTDSYGAEYADAGEVGYADQPQAEGYAEAGSDMYAEASVDAGDEYAAEQPGDVTADAEPSADEYGQADEYVQADPDQGTLEAEPEDVLDEVDLTPDEPEAEAVFAEQIEEEALDEETVVAGGPELDEPEPLPEPDELPAPPDDDERQ